MMHNNRQQKMRKCFIAGNWKMNTTARQAEELARAIASEVNGCEKVDTAVFPPAPYLKMVGEILKDAPVKTGAQNMCWESKGAFTGEMSSTMILDTGCTYVILGHSERRAVFGETDEMINKKILHALAEGLLPVFCVGETLDQRDAGKTKSVVQHQMEGGLAGLKDTDIPKVTIAYEPVWAIGTGKTATSEQAQDVHAFIREWIKLNFNKHTAEHTRIQYGGSVNAKNAAQLLSQKDIDGALVGGASLDPNSFGAIIRSAAENY